MSRRGYLVGNVCRDVDTLSNNGWLSKADASSIMAMVEAALKTPNQNAPPSYQATSKTPTTEKQHTVRRSQPQRGLGKAKALYDNVPEEADDLRFNEGDEITLEEQGLGLSHTPLNFAAPSHCHPALTHPPDLCWIASLDACKWMPNGIEGRAMGNQGFSRWLL